ncbi:MAG: hypothetical protein NTZ80_03560 [Patescibacteria group bacterium]|nr:hypothetical protein [Patescibacteria group bacterium]
MNLDTKLDKTKLEGTARKLIQRYLQENRAPKEEDQEATEAALLEQMANLCGDLIKISPAPDQLASLINDLDALGEAFQKVARLIISAKVHDEQLLPLMQEMQKISKTMAETIYKAWEHNLRRENEEAKSA